MMSRLTLELAGIAVVLSAVAVPSAAQSRRGQIADGEMSIAVQGGRPLADALQTLEELCGCPISYEDPPLLDGEAFIERTIPGTARRVKELRGGSLELSRLLGPGELVSTIPTVVDALIDAHEARQLSGRFRRIVTRSGVVVAPQLGSASGIDSSAVPILDRRIALRAGKMSAREALQSVLDQLGMNGPYEAALGTIPLNVLTATMVDVSDGERTARQNLEAVLSALPGRAYSWRLLFNARTRKYFLNIHLVAPARAVVGQE